MTRTITLAFAIALVGAHSFLVAAPVRAQEASLLQREDDDEVRLRRWMAVRAARSPDSEWVAGIAIPFGALAIGGGITLAALQDELGLTNHDLTAPCAAIVGLGVVEIALGILALTIPNSPRDEYREIPERPLTEREIGRLEGLLRLEARNAELGRTLSLWLGGGLAVGGLAAIPLVAVFPPSDQFQVSLSWGIAGAFALTGLLTFVVALFESPSEADWREYRQGLMPRETPQVSLVPTGDGFAVLF